MRLRPQREVVRQAPHPPSNQASSACRTALRGCRDNAATAAASRTRGYVQCSGTYPVSAPLLVQLSETMMYVSPSLALHPPAESRLATSCGKGGHISSDAAHQQLLLSCRLRLHQSTSAAAGSTAGCSIESAREGNCSLPRIRVAHCLPTHPDSFLSVPGYHTPDMIICGFLLRA